MKTEQVTCKNCENNYDSSFQFCPYCGQKSNDELTLGVLFYNTISNYFSFDARFFKSYIPLMFRPGYLAKKFVEGKRLLYLHPAQMYLFISVIFFFLFSIITRESTQQFDTALKKGIHQTETVMDSIQTQVLTDSVKAKNVLKTLKDNNVPVGAIKDYKELDSLLKSNKKDMKLNTSFNFNERKIDSLIALNASDSEIYKAMGLNDDAGFLKRKFYAQILKFYKQRNGGSILQAFLDSIPIAMFILLPIFALLLKLFYFNKGRFSHHLVFTFYYFSFLFMLFSLMILVGFFWKLPGILSTLIILSAFVYLFLAAKHFYRQGYFLSLIKASMVILLFLSFVLPFTIVILGITAFLFY